MPARTDDRGFCLVDRFSHQAIIHAHETEKAVVDKPPLFPFCDQTKKDAVDRIQKASSLVVRFWGHIVVSDRIESQVNAIVDVLR
jgi:hypothetical protein